MRLIRYESIEALRGAAAAWDDLWQRSQCTLPSARAEPLAIWLEHFAPLARFCAIAIEDGGQLLAALPLVGRRVGRFVPTGVLPGNVWTPGGQLLVDPEPAANAALDLLAGELHRLPWPWLWLEGATRDCAGWPRLLSALDRRQLPHAYQELFRVGTTDTTGDWDEYQASLSGNHRRHMRKALKRAEAEGFCNLIEHADASPEDAARLVEQGFCIEDRGWKGTGGSSVVRSPGILAFFQRQAQALAASGHLHLAFLGKPSQPIAFEYGLSAKGVYYSPKVGFDEAYAQLSPGQLLRFKLMERFFADPARHTFDFAGPISAATAKWTTGDYSLGRLIVGTGHPTSKPLMWSSRSLIPTLRGLRRRWQSQPPQSSSDEDNHGNPKQTKQENEKRDL